MSSENFAQRIKKLTYDWDEFFSYDTSDENKKIFFSKEHPNSAVKDKNSIFYDKLLWDVFTYSMAIGRYVNHNPPFSRKGGTIPIDAAKEHHLYSMLGLVFSLPKVDIQILKQPTEIRKICEDYANGGVEKLIEFERTRENDNPISEYETALMEFLKTK